MEPGWFARLLVPSRCPLCRGMAEPDTLVCGRCIRELNRSPVLHEKPPEGVERIVSCADHAGIARDLLAAFKFRRMTGLCGLIAGFMVDAAGQVDQESMLVQVPPARLRARWRGFDPVAMLTSELAKQGGLDRPTEPVLTRRGSGRQRGRGRAGRMFDPPDIRSTREAGKLIGGRKILLVDDVMTTGATLSAAAGALRIAGANRVSALTFTRRL